MLEKLISSIKKNNLPLKGLIFLLLSYGFILILYTINRPSAYTIKEPASDVYHELNQSMLKEEDYRYLLKMKRNGVVPNKESLKEFKKYFQLVVNSIPNQSDSYAMLGYCHYYLGEEQEAVNAYTAAIQSNPTFMSPYYNLATIFYNQDNNFQAVKLLQQALSCPLQLTAEYIVSSNRIYMLILSQMPGKFPGNLAAYLENEQQNASSLLQLILASIHDPAKASKKKLPLELI